jgi:hypothetical protein
LINNILIYDDANIIDVTSENIATMAPDLYRLPEPGGGYHEERFDTYIAAGEVMIGEWNNVQRVKVEETDRGKEGRTLQN